MPKVLDQVDRDREIWLAYVAGSRQADIAAERGLAQSTVSEAIRRYRATLPPLDKAEELDRSLDLINELIETWKPKAHTSLGAARMLDRLVNTKAKLAGLIQTRVQHEGTVDHAHIWEPGPSVDQVLAPIIAEGRIRPRAELTRLDQ
jgi:predicted transcriptional regulator